MRCLVSHILHSPFMTKLFFYVYTSPIYLPNKNCCEKVHKIQLSEEKLTEYRPVDLDTIQFSENNKLKIDMNF